MELVLIIASLIITSSLGFNFGERNFIKEFSEKPYCIEDKAEVIDKEVLLKRCWKVVEVKE